MKNIFTSNIAQLKIKCLLDPRDINHPIHLVRDDGGRSLSALVPFCEFGGNRSLVGVSMEQFDSPVCNCFKAKLLNDQLCYEVDLNRFSNKSNIEKELSSGFAFIMDYNEDRQITFDREFVREDDDDGLVSRIDESDENQHAFIYLNTIGRVYKLLK